MPRSWSELLGEEEAAPEPETERAGLFSRLRDSLSKSRRALTEQLAVAAFDPGDDLAWERLEEALLQADVGVPATAELVRRLEARGDVGELGAALAEEIALLFGEPPMLDVKHAPAVLLVVGVNGTGKTTTIGKLSAILARPCPFYLLDEVEAALDDTNIGRFVELLRRYADRAQFVVITHQKRTMEAADVLYGVSMAPGGSSRVVSQRISDLELEEV